MLRLVLAVLALVTAAVAAGVAYVYKKRSDFDGYPQPPMPSRFWGHLPLAGECKRLFPSDAHVQTWMNYIRRRYNLGDFFYVDWWPLGPRWLFIADPEIASKYVTTGQSLAKSNLVGDFVGQLLGKFNMVTLDHNQWKPLRAIFNPGFAASHLITLVPLIVDSSLVFLSVLRDKAATGELVPFTTLATRFAIDIIGKVVMETDFDSQRQLHPLVTVFRERINLMPSTASITWLDDLNPIRSFRLWRNERLLNALVGDEIDKRIAIRQQSRAANGTTEKPTARHRSRCVLDLALDNYEADMQAGTNKSGFGANFRALAVDSIKTFIFAGHDTTSATLSYTMHLLHLHPHVHAKVVAELDTVFGVGCTAESIAAGFVAQPHLVNQLEYLNAAIKETLRLYPPASTLRGTFTPADLALAKELFITDPDTGKACSIAHTHIWVVSHMIHRNEKYFPDPLRYVPERFIPSETPYPYPLSKLHTPAGKDAWRPFEKGPRNCIGQELAMIEAKVVLACLVKEIDLTVEFDGEKIEKWEPVDIVEEMATGVPGNERRTVEGSKLYQVLKAAGNPRDSTPGRITLRKKMV